MKKVIGIIFLFAIACILVGCNALDPLSQFERAASKEIIMVQGFDDLSESDIDLEVTDMLANEVNQVISLSSLTLDLSNEEKIENVKTLFESIKDMHLANVEYAKATKNSWDELKINIQEFRAEDHELLPDDKEIIITYRNEIRTKRAAVRDTFGDIKDLFEELRGNYKIENIDMIILNLEQVLAILELRQDYVIYLDSVILEVNSIIAPYHS